MFKIMAFKDDFVFLDYSDYFKLSTAQKYHIFYKLIVGKDTSYVELAKITLQEEQDIDLAMLVLITGIILDSRKYDWGKGPISRSVLENIRKGLMITVFNDRFVVDWQMHNDSPERDKAIRYITSISLPLSVA